MTPVGKDQTVGWGLVGLGRHAKKYVIPAFQASRSSRLVAVCSESADRADAIAKEHGIKSAYYSLVDMLRDEDVSCVYVCSPNHRHHDETIQSAEAGRHVFCEKPLATSVAACSDVVDGCATRHVVLGVGFHLRYNPAHQRAREFIRSGMIGRPLYVEVCYLHQNAGDEPSPSGWRTNPTLAGGGEFLGTGVHAADLVRYLLDTDLTLISAAIVDQVNNEHGHQTVINTVLRTSSGSLVSLVSGRLERPQNRLTVYGDLGALRITGSLGNIGGGFLSVSVGESLTGETFTPVDVYAAEIDDFIEAIKAGRSPISSGEDGLSACALTEAVDAVINTGPAGHL